MATGCTHPAGIGRSYTQHNDRECINCSGKGHFSGHGKCPARGLHKSVDPEDPKVSLHDPTTTGVLQTRPSQSRRGGKAITQYEGQATKMAKEKAEKETASKGKGVDREETADPPTPRMQAKIDAALETPHHPKPALTVFTCLAIQSPPVMRRRNSSPCPYIPED